MKPIMMKYTSPSIEQKDIKLIRDNAQKLMDVLVQILPNHNRFYMEFAISSLEDSIMWALKAIRFDNDQKI